MARTRIHERPLETQIELLVNWTAWIVAALGKRDSRSIATYSRMLIEELQCLQRFHEGQVEETKQAMQEGMSNQV